MAIQFSQPPSYQSHMFGPARHDKDTRMVFSHRGSNPDNGFNVNKLPNLPEIQDSMPNKSDADTATASQMNNWTTKSPQEWNVNDVLDWLFCLLEQKQLDGSKFKGEAYSKFTGRDLCAMERDEFERIDSCYGSVIYDNLQNLLQKELLKNETCRPGSRHSILGVFNSNFIEECCSVDENNNINSSQMDVEPCLERAVNEACDNRNIYCKSDLKVLLSDNEIKVDIPSLGLYTISREFEFPARNYDCSTFLPQPSTSLHHNSSDSPPSKLSSIPTSLQLSVTPYLDSICAAGLRPKFGELHSPPAFQNASSPSSKSASSSLDARLFPPFPKTSQTPRFQYTSSPSSKSVSSSLDSQLFPWFSAISPTSACSTSACSTLACSTLTGSTTCPMTPLTLRADSNDPGYSSDDSTCSLSFMPPMASPQRAAAFCSDIHVGINGSSDQMAQISANNARQNNRKAAKTGFQLWKFVLELLQDPDANPRLLKWEDRNSGVFRFVQSEKVAQLWGKKKNNPQMTYEKMSRAMRFCRTIGYFSEIEKNGRFPKKLCFKFGIKSYGWKD